MAEVTRGGFAKRLCDGLEVKASDHRTHALVAWMSAENAPAKFNPLATTWPLPSATDYNSVHVKNYATLTDGVKATLLTLERGDPSYGYQAILSAIKANDAAAEILEAVANSAWGTGALAIHILPYVKKQYERYASVPIGQ